MRALSLIIPTLNEERYLPGLLESLLLCKGFENWEIIVVDGRSDDQTCAVVENFQCRTAPPLTIRLISCNERNVSHQRNVGAAQACNETLAFLDADTVIPTPDRLRQLFDAFQSGGHAAATCRFTPLEQDWRARCYYNILYFFHRITERVNPYAVGACLLTTKTVFVQCGGFDPTIRINEDANYCQRAAQHGTFRVLPVTLKTSARRFAQHGYLRMGLRYVKIVLRRTLHGEIRDDRIPYEFGRYE